MFRVAVATLSNPLINWTVPVGTPPPAELTVTEKFTAPQDKYDVAAGLRLTDAGNADEVTVRDSDLVEAA